MSSRKLAKDRKTMEASRGSRTTGARKQFSSSAYQQHNGPAIEAVLQYLDGEGMTAMPNPDQFGPDLILYHGFQPVSYIEVEQRNAWKTGYWPDEWKEIHIPERKAYMYSSLSMSCSHWIISKDSSFAVIIPDIVISTFGVLKEFSNSQVREGELFIHVPAEECIHLLLRSSPDGKE